MEPTPSQKNSPAIPIAIIVGFALIAVAIFFSGGKSEQPKAVTQTTNENAEVISNGTPRTVDGSDYIRGNPNAPILMVEYSDYDCPFCKQFHDTMKQIIEEFGVEGQVAWVYRQFPLKQLHPNSEKISEAALCVGDIGGNEKFWQYTDLIFEQRDVDQQTNITKLSDYAERIGVDRAAFDECTRSGRMQAKVQEGLKEGFDIGARGTPYTLLIAGNQQAVINGAQSYVTVRGIISNLIDQLNGKYPEGTSLSEISEEPAQ